VTGGPGLQAEYGLASRLGHVRAKLIEGPDTAARAGHEAGIAQLGEVVADGRLAELEGRREVADADRLGGLGQDVHELDAHRVGERTMQGCDLLGPIRGQGRGHRLAAALDPAGRQHGDGYEH